MLTIVHIFAAAYFLAMPAARLREEHALLRLRRATLRDRQLRRVCDVWIAMCRVVMRVKGMVV